MFVLHGPITGSGAATITIKCPGCRKKNIFTAAQLREIARLGRQAQRVQKADQRAKVADAREAKRLNAEAREIETNNLNEDLEERIRVLNGLLSATLDVDDYIEFESLKEEMVALPFAAGELGKEEPKPYPEAFLPPEPGGVGKLFGGKKYEEQKIKGMAAYEQAIEAYNEREKQRQSQLLAMQTEHEVRVRALQGEVDQQHAEVDSLQQRFSKGDPAAIVSYFTQVLEASDYPPGFPHHTRMAFVSESKQLVVELELPGIEVVPKARAYKYVKRKTR